MKVVFRYLVAVILLMSTPGCASADLKPVPDEPRTETERLFEKYWGMQQDRQARLETKVSPEAPPPVVKQPNECPGLIVGEWPERPDALFCEDWPFRTTTYEIFFASKKLVGRTIYGLALFTRDLDPNVSLERFEKGAGGFHYNIGQIVEWANAVDENRQKVYTLEERRFFEKLLQDGVLRKEDGKVVSTGLIAHVLGVAPLKNRNLELNLSQERTHVMWDEDPSFRQHYIDKWKTLSDADKEEVYKELKGYNRENEAQIIEEWAVYQNEKKRIWKK